MDDFRSLSDFTTLYKSDVVWIGQITGGITSNVPKPGDTVLVKYAYDGTRTTQTDILDEHVLHFPETLKNLSMATLNHDMLWEFEVPSHPRHPSIENFNTRHIFSMQKGQEIIIVRMLQDKKVCIGRDKINGNDVFLDNGMGKSCVLQIQEILYQNSKRTFLFPKLPKNIEEPMKNLSDNPFLTFEESSFGESGVFVHVDTQKYSLMAVHTAIAQLLLSEAPTLRAGLPQEGERELFIKTTAKACRVSEPAVQQGLLAFAEEWHLKDQLILVEP